MAIIMKQEERTRKLLIMHYQKYPQLQIQDLFKYLHQSSFGCEHMVSSLKTSIEYIRNEIQEQTFCDDTLIDVLDGEYSRVHLAYISQGLSVETLGKLFFSSAKKEENGRTNLEKKLKVAKELIRENILPFHMKEIEKAMKEWQVDGYPAKHHSDVFRATYNPAYRVIANKYVKFLPTFATIDKMLQNGSQKIVIESDSANDKTLSEILEEFYDCKRFNIEYSSSSLNEKQQNKQEVSIEFI